MTSLPAPEPEFQWNSRPEPSRGIPRALDEQLFPTRKTKATPFSGAFTGAAAFAFLGVAAVLFKGPTTPAQSAESAGLSATFASAGMMLPAAPAEAPIDRLYRPTESDLVPMPIPGSQGPQPAAACPGCGNAQASGNFRLEVVHDGASSARIVAALRSAGTCEGSYLYKVALTESPASLILESDSGERWLFEGVRRGEERTIRASHAIERLTLYPRLK